jgi:hypothetical protein
MTKVTLANAIQATNAAQPEATLDITRSPWPPNGWPLSCGRAQCYHDSIRAPPPALLEPAAVSFSGLLAGACRDD